ncbi:MAG TPA: GNAT family protein [Flavipsychrobacter sp.]|nr:GNAT family protein [Flavipsychrobacter sp.]
MNWINHPILLEGDKVKLIPLESIHIPELLEIAKQKEIWNHYSVDCSNPQILSSELRSTLLKRATGEQYTFTIIDKINNKIIGSTRIYNFYPEHKRLEIGWTWYAPAYWGTGYNTECKLLLLTYCFETLKTIRVQLQTDEHNLRSRAAIQKIGAKFEGILRKERVRTNGTIRNTAIFSIIDDEWEEVKNMLQNRLVENNITKVS